MHGNTQIEVVEIFINEIINNIKIKLEIFSNIYYFSEFVYLKHPNRPNQLFFIKIKNISILLVLFF